MKTIRDLSDEDAVVDQLADFKERHGYDWPNCGTPDCENKACVPSDLCHPCSLRFYGVDFRPNRGNQ